jgi:hypothetical protein
MGGAEEREREGERKTMKESQKSANSVYREKLNT